MHVPIGSFYDGVTCAVRYGDMAQVALSTSVGAQNPLKKPVKWP